MKDATLRSRYDRGKGGDVLEERGLRVLYDGVLAPGDVLYVPAGFPHTTATPRGPSFHLTFGVACTNGFGLGLGALRRLATSPPVSRKPLHFTST